MRSPVPAALFRTHLRSAAACLRLRIFIVYLVYLYGNTPSIVLNPNVYVRFIQIYISSFKCKQFIKKPRLSTAKKTAQPVGHFTFNLKHGQRRWRALSGCHFSPNANRAVVVFLFFWVERSFRCGFYWWNGFEFEGHLVFVHTFGFLDIYVVSSRGIRPCFLDVFKARDPAYKQQKTSKTSYPDLDHHHIIITVELLIFTRKRMKSWFKWPELNRVRAQYQSD